MFTIKNEEVFRKKGRVNQLAYVFRLPDIGEGIHEGEIVKWFVEEGQEIKKMTYFVKFKMINQL